MAKHDKTGKRLEKRVAQAYRDMGARKVEHDVELAGHQIDVYVEIEGPDRSLHRVAVEAKDRERTVGKGIVTDFEKVADFLRRERLIDDAVIVSATGFSRQARTTAHTSGIRPLEPGDLDQMVGEAKAAGRPSPAEVSLPLPPEPYFAHPYPLQEHFTGRARERRTLTEWFTRGPEPLFACVAIGGMGKSALTWAWVIRDVLGLPLPGAADDLPEAAAACRVPEAERPEGVLWWSFYESELGFADFLDRAISYASGKQVDPSAVASRYEKIDLLLGLLRTHRLLVVLDGFERELRAYATLGAPYQGDDLTEDEQGGCRACTDPHLGDLLRLAVSQPLQGKMVLTSRLFPKELDGLAGCCVQNLASMEPADAITFFRTQGVRGSPAEIRAACKPYGYHPLCLRLLSGMIVGDPAAPADIAVASEYDPVPQLKRKKHHILTVAYEALDSVSRELLELIAAFRSPVVYQVLADLNPELTTRDLKRALRQLTIRGLALFDSKTARFDLHPVIRQYAYDRLSDKKGTHTRLINYFATAPARITEMRKSAKDVTPAIELYHHTVMAGLSDRAWDVFRKHLLDPLYYRLGDYRNCLQLLKALFPEGLSALPKLKRDTDTVWASFLLAKSYSLSGQPRRAIEHFQRCNQINDKPTSRFDLALGLRAIASDAYLPLGELAAAEGALLRTIVLLTGWSGRGHVAAARQELGLLRAYQGDFKKASRDLRLSASFGLVPDTEEGKSRGINWAYRSLCALLMGDTSQALEAGRRADAQAQTRRSAKHRTEVMWLLGTALVARAEDDAPRRDAFLAEAEHHLTQALMQCRRSGLVEREPDVLLAWARWHSAKGDRKSTREAALDALYIADRCEYRLKQAEIHNFLARLALESGDKNAARKEAGVAKEHAWCDGPPHSYKPALDEADRLLAEL